MSDFINYLIEYTGFFTVGGKLYRSRYSTATEQYETFPHSADEIEYRWERYNRGNKPPLAIEAVLDGLCVSKMPAERRRELLAQRVRGQDGFC